MKKGSATSVIDEASAEQVVESVLRYMRAEGILSGEIEPAPASVIVSDRQIASVRPEKAGFFRPLVKPGDRVLAHQPIARLEEVYFGQTLEELVSPCDGIVFFVHDEPLTYANTAVCKIIRCETPAGVLLCCTERQKEIGRRRSVCGSGGMHIWDKLTRYFNERKFLPVDLHREGMCLFYIADGQSASLVWLLQDSVLSGLTREQYENYLKTIQGVFFKRGFEFVPTMALFLTSDIAHVKEVAQGSMYWIADEVYGRLVVFEDQPEDFLGLRTMLENNLAFAGESKRSEEAISPEDRKRKQEARRSWDKENRRRKMRGTYENVSRYSWVTLVLIALNVFVFVLTDLFRLRGLLENGCLYWPSLFYQNEYYRVFTCMFLHADIGHISSNMIALFSIGDIVEREMGHFRFALLYFVSGLLASMTSVCYFYFQRENSSSVGASGAIYGVAGALLMIFLTNSYLRRRENLIRMGIFVVFLFYPMFTGTQGIDYAAHLGGFVSGALIYWIQSFVRPKRGRSWKRKF